MPISPHELHQLIASRRAVYPNAYTGQPIGREVIEQVLENANWAPTHKRTEPWRFKVMTGTARHRLSEYLASWYHEHTAAADFSEMKMKKITEKPLQSACVIAICMQRDPKFSLPEWEEIAAVACAVQNMWLTCTTLGIGCYWSTHDAAIDAGEFLGCAESERCLGFFYMGYWAAEPAPGTRQPVSGKTVWL